MARAVCKTAYVSFGERQKYHCVTFGKSNKKIIVNAVWFFFFFGYKSGANKWQNINEQKRSDIYANSNIANGEREYTAQ